VPPPTAARSAPRFLFVTCGAFSGVAEPILAGLEQEFPDATAVHVDLPELVRRRRLLALVNLLFVLVEWGPGALLDRRRRWGAFFRTSLMFRWIRRETRRRAAREHYLFTFQTQSLFDASVAGVPHFVYTDHTELVNRQYPWPDPHPAPESWIRREQGIYRRAAAVLVWSGHVARSLAEDYGVEPERIVWVGVGGDGEPEPSAGSYDSCRILFVGRDWERKGGPDLLVAFAGVRRQLPEATLVVAGSRPEVEEPGVTVLGEVGPATVRRLMAEAAVFCMPTLREPFGLVFVEAAIHGLPVVATRTGALPDIVVEGETGHLVRPHDVEGLSERLAGLLADPAACARLGVAARRRALERWTWRGASARIAAAVRLNAAHAKNLS
jgi:glycosyltransferase involved in cell wall biosynthesis